MTKKKPAKSYRLSTGREYQSLDWCGDLTRRRFRVVRRCEGFKGDSFHGGALPTVDLLTLSGKSKGVTHYNCTVRSRGGIEYADISGDEIAVRVIAK
jgi:hypothetical protein